MALGANVNIKDKLIKKTTVKAAKQKKESKTHNINITSKLGLPSANPKTDTFGTRKMTFYIKGDMLRRLYNFAYWDRHSLTEAFNLVMEDGLKGKKTKEKE